MFELRERLQNRAWSPDSYMDFYVRDPKLRHIHKATVRDRVLNQAVFRVLYKIFDKHFIHDSYSCRVGKGTHAGVTRLQKFIRKITRNYTRPAFILKCDVRKFFDSMSHEVLLNTLRIKINDPETCALVEIIVKSFETAMGKGLPLGNITSQLFANVYLNELDQFVKHTLRAKYYIRYCDDFVILETDREKLIEFICQINKFLSQNLHLTLHPQKISLKKVRQGIDFLGYVVLPHHTVLRTKTKRRILKKIKRLKGNYSVGLVSGAIFDQTINSYLGMLAHCRGNKIKVCIVDTLKNLC